MYEDYACTAIVSIVISGLHSLDSNDHSNRHDALLIQIKIYQYPTASQLPQGTFFKSIKNSGDALYSCILFKVDKNYVRFISFCK